MDAVPGSSSDSEIRFSRKEIYFMVKGYLNNPLRATLEHLEEQLAEKTGHSIRIIEKEMKLALSRLFYLMRKKWDEANRNEDRFLKYFKEWLTFPVAFRIPAVTSEKSECKGGRPSSEFTSSSERSKRRKTEEIRKNFSSEQLCYATHMSLRSEGKVDASEIIKDISATSPSRATAYRKSVQKVVETTLSGDTALSLVIENKLSKRQYLGLRTTSKENNCHLYPPYNMVLEAKRRCYPSAMDIKITEYSAEVKLQALLDHSVQRILLVQNNIIRNLAPSKVRHMTLICKWGCDGSSSQSMYKQTFTIDGKSDSEIFLTSLVPLQLLSDENIIIWKNAKPSSPRFCRPIKIQFLHETTEATISETTYIENEIQQLVPFDTIIDGKEISILYKLALTMIDGKICNAISSTLSTQRCYLCGSTAKQFNDINKMLQQDIDESHLRFGLSSLHAWIRFFECCLHLSYRLPIKKWQARSNEEKDIVKKRKEIIQQGFRTQLGLLVDRPKPGFGSTNDGNTARRFFENHQISASITGVDEDIIKSFFAILQAISSGYDVNLNEFKKYAVVVATRFVDLYPWYYMPTSVHKILIHGSEIINSALLPIGQMSEEAQEHVNKYIKSFRKDFSRKCSRVKTMEDVFMRLLISSDPYISNLKKQPERKYKKLTPDARNLLILPIITEESTDDDTDGSSD